MDKTPVLRIPVQKTGNKVEMAKFIIDILCYIQKIKLSKMEVMCLCHFMTEGYSEITKEQIVTSGISKNRKSLANVLTTLRNYHILVREQKFPFNEVLAPAFRFTIPDKLKIEITLDNL